MSVNLAQIIASIFIALISGGIGSKLLDRVYLTKDTRKKQETDLESQYLNANVSLRQELFKKVDKLEEQIETWRERYGNLYNEAQDQKDTYRSLKRDYEELKDMHQELKDMHEQLKQTHDKREQAYEELRIQHEKLLHTCDNLEQEISRSKQEISRFEKQINKDMNEVRKEVGAATSI